MFRSRGGIAAIVVAIIIGAGFARIAAAQPGETVMTCTNPASGANWQIRIDYRHATVDSNAARVSESEISWHDPTDGGNYTLDRKSGELTLVGASSTGGYFLHDRCSPEKSG